MAERDEGAVGTVCDAQQGPTRATVRPSRAAWTVLTYLAGDNDFEDSLLDDLDVSP